MGKPLEGIRIVEVAMWAFVPACGGLLSDLGADVIKIEPPTGDPLRGLQTHLVGGDGIAGKGAGLNLSWESYNRGKRSITLDLKHPEGRDALMKLLDGADVFLTNLLPPARKAMGIDADTIRAKFPKIIYASGSGTGPHGPEAAKGGYDSITYWARGGISATMTEDGSDHPVGLPGPAFGDSSAGAMLAAAICAAMVKRDRTGESSTVDVSLLGTAMWSMQRLIAQATLDGRRRFPRPRDAKPNNLLVAAYQTSDDRFVKLCMLQSDKYWTRFCEVAGRADLASDPRYASATLRKQNVDTCLSELKALFRSKTLAEWKRILASQDGQWDVVQDVGELMHDVQVQANSLLQTVDYDGEATIPLVAVPILFDGETMPARRSPDLGANSDEVLATVGYDEDAIIELKVKGVVF